MPEGGECAAADERFFERLSELPSGYVRGTFLGETYGVTVSRSGDGARVKLYGEQLGGSDHVSFNLYRLGDGEARLKPCEMPAEKVIAFVLGFVPDP